MKNRLIVFMLSLCFLVGAAIRGSPIVFAAEQDRDYAPVKSLSVTYVDILSFNDWSESAYYEDDLDDMLIFFDDRGSDNTFVFRYRFEIDTLSDVMIKYRASLRKTKYGYFTVNLAESSSADGSTVITNRQLDWNDGYWVGRLSVGTYYLNVPVVMESAGSVFYPNGWKDNPYMRYDITAKVVPLFGGAAMVIDFENLKSEIKERIGSVYGNFNKIR